jgi:ribonuclease-3
MTRAQRVAALERRLGHTFKDQSLLMRALTHKSAGDGVRGFRHNERLEWLGDRVLGLAAAKRLHDAHPRAEEGELTRRFNAVVNGDNCAAAAKALELQELLAVSKSVGEPRGLSGTSILSDAFEAVLGALYLDGGPEACEAAVDLAWELAVADVAPTDAANPKSALQEWAQKRGRPAPIYETLSREGPDHAPVFTVRCHAVGRIVEASGGSKQAAERAAAAILLKGLNADD